MHRRALQLLCAFFLLFAQQSALTHAAWHAVKNAPLEQRDAAKSQPQAAACALDGAFAQVLGAVTAHLFEIVRSAPPRILAIASRNERVTLDLPLARSRGPPVRS